jgi:protein-L-isoaspartate O-methyltransferase
MNFPAFTDTYRQKGERKLLAAQLQKKGINDEKVLAVIAEVPRHFSFLKIFGTMPTKTKPFKLVQDKPFRIHIQ